jgi:hypothetical protein
MFDSLFRFLARQGRPLPRRKPRPKAPPRLEALEDRWVPSAADSVSMQSLLGSALAGPSGTPVALSLPAPNVGMTPPGATSNPGTTNASPPAASSPPAQGPGGPTVTAPTTPSTGGTQTQQVTATFTPFTTGGSQTQTVGQFNPTLGTLTGVQVILNGTLTSDVKVESFDSAASNFTAQVNGNLQLQGPGIQSLAVNPSLNENTTLTAYDGVMDFGGTSGHDFGNQSAQASQSVTLTAGANNLAAWVGTGNVSLTESAQSSSTMNGSGNEDTHVCSTGSGTVQVIYSYTPATAPQSPPPVSPPPASPPPCNNPPVSPPASPPPGPQSPPPISPPPVSPPPAPPPATCTTPTGPGQINGIVYVDAGHQGHYVTTDTGVPGVTVNLTGVTLTGQSVNLTTTTGSDGSYSFTNLQAGIYTLSDVQPSSYTAGTLNLGSLGGIVQNNQMIVALPQGGDGMCYDFGELPPSPPPAPPPPPSPNGGGVPLSPPPGTTPPQSPPPGTTFDPSLFATSGPISKRSLIGGGWQSLG